MSYLINTVKTIKYFISINLSYFYPSSFGKLILYLMLFEE